MHRVEESDSPAKLPKHGYDPDVTQLVIPLIDAFWPRTPLRETRREKVRLSCSGLSTVLLSGRCRYASGSPTRPRSRRADIARPFCRADFENR